MERRGGFCNSVCSKSRERRNGLKTSDEADITTVSPQLQNQVSSFLVKFNGLNSSAGNNSRSCFASPIFPKRWNLHFKIPLL